MYPPCNCRYHRPHRSQQVLSVDKKGKQDVRKLVRKLHRTNKYIDSEANGQRGPVTIDTATGRVSYAGASIRSSWNTFGRAVPGVSHAKGALNRGN